MRGHFITLEGMDGAGKSTLLNVITAWHATHKIAYHITREPGGTPLGETLRTLLLHEDMDLNTEALLMFAARQQHINQIIRPKLAQGISVICDRFTDASFAYQSGGRGLAWEKVQTLADWVHADLQPDWTIFLDVPVALSQARLAQRPLDRFEQENSAFFERVRAAYQQRIAQQPTRFCVIDASQDLPTVQHHVEAALAHYWAKHA